MERYQNNLSNSLGVAVAGASVTVLTYPGGAKATIYSDNGVTVTSNPLTTSSTGYFAFYAANGHYSLQVSGTNVVGATFTDIILNDAIITDLPAAGTLTGSELVGVSQSGLLVQTTTAAESTLAISPIANGTSTDAGTLTGAEIAPVSRGSGLLQTTFNTLAAFVLSIFTFLIGLGAGEVARSLLSWLLDQPVDAKAFGATGNGVTDDTAALQAWLTYVIANNRRGLLPQGNYLISAALTIPTSQNWAIQGEAGGTTITQNTNNVPILNFGASGSATSYGVHLSDITFTYANTQAVANTAANCIFFNTMWFHVTMERLTFNAGYYGIGLLSGVGCPWGCYWNDLVFGGTLSGGAINWNGGVNATPNNVWGRFTVTAASMAGPIFNQIRGYNWTIEAIEILSVTNAQLMNTQAASVLTIGAIKLEVYSYTAAYNLLDFTGNGHIRINQFNLGGTTGVLNPASGTINIFNQGGSTGTGYLELGTIVVGATTLGSNVYILGAVCPTRLKDLSTDANSWQLSNFASSTTLNTLTVDRWKNDELSPTDNGDANYTATLGDPNIIRFETALTAPRTIALDSVGNNLFSGMYREFRIKGAINGSNTITISCNSTTLVTLTADCVIRFTFSRIDAAHISNCWKVTKYNTGLPA